MKRFIRRKGWTITQAAKEIGVSRVVLHRWLLGHKPSRMGKKLLEVAGFKREG